MIYLKKKYEEYDSIAEQRIAEIYNFTNEKVPVIIFDANYSIFGEFPQDIPG